MRVARKQAEAWSDFYIGLSESELTAPGRPSACWELVRHVYRGELGVFLPPRSAGSGWKLVNPLDAQAFDLVVFEQGGVAGHVGIIVEPWRILHVPESADGNRRETSRVERFDNGSFLPRLSGVYRRSMAAPHMARPPLPQSLAADRVGLLGIPFINPENARPTAVPSGKTLAELVHLLYPATSEDQRARMRVSIGRADIPPERWTEIDRDNWQNVTPHPGVIVAVEPLPGAIPWGKVVGLLAITAALVAGQYYLGPLLAAQLGFTAGTFAYGATVAVTTAATVTAASILVSLLFGGEKPGGKDRPSFAATGWQNRPRLFEPVPNPLGVTRDAPGYGALPYMSQEDGDDGLSPIFLHGLFVEAVGEGEISNRRFGDTDIDNFDDGEGSPVTVEEGLVEPGGTWPFSFYDHTVVPTDPSTMGARFEGTEEDSDYVERAAARDATSLEVFIYFLAGFYNTNDTDGDAETARVNFAWEYAPIGTDDWVVLDWTEVSEGTRSPVYFSHKWEVPRGDYKMRHKKTGRDDDFDDDSSQASYVWIALQAHRPEVPIASRAPLTCTAFRVRSTDQLQGTIQAYNRIFSRKTLDWDEGTETWVFRETASPAAALRYILQSAALAIPYANDQIDLDGLAAWSEYADDKGLTYNAIGGDDPGLLDKLTEIANAGRGRSRRYNREWGVVVDKPTSIISGHITPRNGWAISVTTQRTPEANGFRVTFQDQTSDYTTKTRIVPFPGVLEADVTKPLELSLAGVTDPDQVYREATRLYYQLFELKLPKWSATASWDHMTYGAGDRVLLDDGLLRTRVSALVSDVSGNFVTLDEAVTMLAGHSYQIQFRHLPSAGSETPTSPPAQTITRTVRTVAGETDTVFLTGAGVSPAEPDLVIFSEVGAGGIDAVVEQITAGDELTGQLLLSPYTPDLDDVIDDLVVPPWDGRVGSIPGEGDAAPEDVSANAMMFNVSGGSLKGFAHVTWTALTYEVSPGIFARIKSYQMRWRIVGSALAPSTKDVNIGDNPTGSANTGILDPVEDYEVSVRGRNGTWSSWVAVPDVTLLLADTDVLLKVDTDTLARVA